VERRVRRLAIMHPLDNVIWKALTTNQAHFAEISDLARRFSPEISLLGAIEQPIAKAYDSLARLIGTKPVGLFLEEPPQVPAGWSVESAAPKDFAYPATPRSVQYAPIPTILDAAMPLR